MIARKSDLYNADSDDSTDSSDSGTSSDSENSDDSDDSSDEGMRIQSMRIKIRAIRHEINKRKRNTSSRIRQSILRRFVKINTRNRESRRLP